MLERIDDEQQRLEMIDLKILVDDPFHLERIALNCRRGDGVFEFRGRAEQAAAVGFDFLAFAHEAELDREPEESRHRLDVAFDLLDLGMFVAELVGALSDHARDFAESHEHVSEGFVGMHGDVACDVVEDVRLGKIVERFAIANRDRGGERSLAKAVKELVRGDVAGNRFGLEAGERLEELIHIFELGNLRATEAEFSLSTQKSLVGESFPLGLDALVKSSPGVLILITVQLIRLFDVEAAIGLSLLDERSFGRGQSTFRRGFGDRAGSHGSRTSF